MGLIKEYVDRAVQTEADTAPSPYADPAVVLAAPLSRHAPASSPTGSSPTSPMLAHLVSRRLSKRRHARCIATDRRIVSMPENKGEMLSSSHSKRVVSMPDRIRPALEPSAELRSPSAAAGDSFGSYSDRHERVRVFCTPSDVPQTPSPPSSPESLLIIASGTQLPDGFLRRKYTPEPLIEEDEDWVTWASSPPRPIPALHGPLSLPYARCPSGAEGTIIEEPDNVAQMIWGLGPGDQPHNQRTEGLPYPDNPLQVPSQVPSRLQKKRTSVTQHAAKSSRQVSSHTNYPKQSLARPARQIQDDKRSQVSLDVETSQDIASGLLWNEAQPMSANIGVPDNHLNDPNVFSVDNNSILEWQLARLQQALRTSLVDVDSYGAYPGRLEPVISAAVASGLPPSYPRIFVEPRPNESVSSATRHLPIEIAQQYRQQQLYRQALQKQKLQIQNLLPTPPNSSSPQWSSHFSPYLTYCSAFPPELAGSTEHTVLASPQKYRSGTNASQHPHHAYDPLEHDDAENYNTGRNISLVKTPQIVPIDSAPSLGQSSPSSSTLAKYIKQLQALSPITHISPLQPDPSPNVPLAQFPSIDESTGPVQSVYRPPVVPTPPSPESPQTVSRGSSYHTVRPITRAIQRRLSAVPEEDSALLELSTSVSPSRLQNQVAVDSFPSSHDGTTGQQICHVDVTRKSTVPDFPEFESGAGAPSITFYHESSPVKVRLPVTKGHNTREQTSGYHEQNKEGQGHRKKHRYKKPKGPATTNEQATTRGLVGSGV